MSNPQSPPSDSTQHHQYEEATVGTWDHTETQPEGILKDDGDGNVTGVDHHQHARPAAYDGITSRGDLNMSPAAPLVPLAATKQSHRTQSSVPPVLAWSIRRAESRYRRGVPFHYHPLGPCHKPGHRSGGPKLSSCHPLLPSPSESPRRITNCSAGDKNRSPTWQHTYDEDDRPRYNHDRVLSPLLPTPPTPAVLIRNKNINNNNRSAPPADNIPPRGIVLPPIMPSVMDRVTVDIALFMHLVDTYSNSGDYLKRMRLCDMMQSMIDGFVPAAASDNEVDEDGEMPRPLRCLPFGSFTYNMHLPWASDLDFVLLPASRRYRRLLAPSVTVGEPQKAHYGQPYQHKGCDDEAHAGGFEDPVKTAAGCVELLKMVSGYLTECAAPGIISTAPVVITSSRVPLITLACRDPALDDELYQQCGTCNMGLNAHCSLHSPVQVQISLLGAFHTGLETSAYIAMMNQHFDCLRPLVLFVKHVLLCEGLISPYNGGISSYTLVLLVVSFLNQFYSADSWTGVPLGQLLLHFLMWYGGPDDDDQTCRNLVNENLLFVLPDGSSLTFFDASRLVIRPFSSSDDTLNFTLRESTNDELIEAFKVDMLVILDPLSPNGEHVNLGKSAWRWPGITAALRSAKNSLIKGGWWGEKYGISVPTVWIGAKRAGYGGSGGLVSVEGNAGESSASATGTTRSSEGGAGLCRDADNDDDDDDDDDDEEATTIRSSTLSRAETCYN